MPNHVTCILLARADDSWQQRADKPGMVAAERNPRLHNSRLHNPCLHNSNNSRLQVLLGLNKRDARVFDVHRLSLSTGQLTLDTTNPGGWAGCACLQTAQLAGCKTKQNTSAAAACLPPPSALPACLQAVCTTGGRALQLPCQCILLTAHQVM